MAWAEPEFVSLDTGNFRLLPDSPCVNAGANAGWMKEALDLDGYTRIDRFSGVVDIGCYEYVPRGSLYTVK